MNGVLKYQVICKFKNWKIKNRVYQAKKQMKGNIDKMFITEDLTRVRQSVITKLSAAKRQNLIQSYWTSDGRIFCKKTFSSPKILVKSVDHAIELFPTIE